jgi:Do/DeqQ family serine protease
MPGGRDVIVLNSAMALRDSLRFVLQSVTVGLAAAIVLLFLLPRFGQRPVVEVVQAPSRPEASAATPGQGPVSYADAVASAQPAVVNVHTARVVVQRPSPLLQDPVLRHFFGQPSDGPTQRIESSLGSGVIISAQGFVLTNHHVIDGAEEIQVMLADGRSAAATVVGVDPETDLAVLRVALDRLPAITLGDSEGLRVGDVVLAIGNPFGVGQTVTMGIVSATGRSHLGLSTFENFIQTDAAINPGNSGGALVDAHGRLVGINTAIFTKSGGSQGIGFAIPVNLAKGVLAEIIELGRVSRGWLGVEVHDLTAELAESFDLRDAHGVVVAGVLRQGPAQRAGIEPGDVITAVDGARVESQRQLLDTVARSRPGSRLQVDLVRTGRPLRVEVAVAERPPTASQR